MSCWGKDSETNQHKIYGEGNSLMNVILPVLAIGSSSSSSSPYTRAFKIRQNAQCYKNAGVEKITRQAVILQLNGLTLLID